MKPAKTRKVASASTNAAPTAMGPNRAVGPLSSNGAAPCPPKVFVAPVKFQKSACRPSRPGTQTNRDNPATMLPDCDDLGADGPAAARRLRQSGCESPL